MGREGKRRVAYFIYLLFFAASSLVMDGSVLSATNIELFPGVTIGDHKKQVLI